MLWKRHVGSSSFVSAAACRCPKRGGGGGGTISPCQADKLSAPELQHCLLQYSVQDRIGLDWRGEGDLPVPLPLPGVSGGMCRYLRPQHRPPAGQPVSEPPSVGPPAGHCVRCRCDRDWRRQQAAGISIQHSCAGQDTGQDRTGPGLHYCSKQVSSSIAVDCGGGRSLSSLPLAESQAQSLPPATWRRCPLSPAWRLAPGGGGLCPLLPPSRRRVCRLALRTAVPACLFSWLSVTLYPAGYPLLVCWRLMHHPLILLSQNPDDQTRCGSQCFVAVSDPSSVGSAVSCL